MATAVKILREPCLLTDEEIFSPVEMVVAPITTTKKHKKSKKVHFFESVGIRATLHFRDMTAEEIYNAWYNREEMSNLKAILIDELQQILSGVPITSMGTDFTLRGLEYGIEHQQQNRIGGEGRSKSNSIQAVFNEQDRQYFAGYYCFDDEAIRAAYLNETIEYSMQARMLGKIDEVEATMIFRNNNKKNRRKHASQNDNNNNTAYGKENCSISSQEEEEEELFLERQFPFSSLV
mmetsp:Transcript_27293/g.31155  ORF Transcript_27293/g.31155 Transcript_27293/m.31155 type:complete len:235 (+) Transcript_27293:157-861(+)|eukprot:CAMPEP_0194150192 /NCGR_PEP_ID=MMETSP0152-20130528/41982_1 /TAXON_ID=1049557 /ORGANISM="Thalassiothrix antarctica, Strain L6-D1" /LENGTH=234 /DNA_ID=CAMNT_0038852937 /DNA_START=209 /DNA_END=913 /DNA_ORIENTATION=+